MGLPSPGPWESYEFGQRGLDGPSCFRIGRANDPAFVVADTFGYSERDSANAHLLAAAPELLASLQTIVGSLRSWWGEGSGELEEGELLLAESRIAKALGSKELA